MNKELEILNKLSSGGKAESDFALQKNDRPTFIDPSLKGRLISGFSYIIDSIETHYPRMTRMNPENIAVHTLYICALHSAFHQGNESSLYEILKDSENLIQDILASDKINYDTQDIVEINQYSTLPLEYRDYDTYTKTYHPIKIYENFLPIVHISNIDKEYTDFLKAIHLFPLPDVWNLRMKRKIKQNEDFSEKTIQFEEVEKEMQSLIIQQNQVNKMFLAIEEIKTQFLKKMSQSSNKILRETKLNISPHKLIGNISKPKTDLEIEKAKSGISKALSEINEENLPYLMLAIFDYNSIVRGQSQEYKMIFDLSILLDDMNIEEKEHLYDFLKEIILEWDYQRATASDFIAIVKNDAYINMPLEISFSLHGGVSNKKAGIDGLSGRRFIKKLTESKQSDTINKTTTSQI